MATETKPEHGQLNRNRDFIIIGLLDTAEGGFVHSTIMINGRRRPFWDWSAGDPLPPNVRRFHTSKAARNISGQCCGDTAGLKWTYHVLAVARP